MNLHPLSTGSLRTLLGLFRRYGCDLDRFPQGALTVLLSLISAPVRLRGRRYFRQALRSSSLGSSPIFIVGHWRSGTTYLHNILSQDPQFGYVSLIHALGPEVSIEKQPVMRLLLQQSLPKTRPQDNVGLATDSPQEEDFPIAAMSAQSFFHSFYFPCQLRSIFHQSVLFEDSEGQPSRPLRSDWRSSYIKVLKRASLEFDGRQLLLKNPANTARIDQLLTLFPDAKFVHIYRNPYDVFFSTQNLYRKMSIYAFKQSSEVQLEADIFWVYQRLMEKFFEDRELIPPENLVEVRFEDLAANPMGQLQAIYEGLGLRNYPVALPHLQGYVESQSRYLQNRYQADPAVLDKIYLNWKFTIDRWGYQPALSQA